MESSRRRTRRLARFTAMGCLATRLAGGQSVPSATPAVTSPEPASFLDIASDSSCPAAAEVNGVLGQILGVRDGEHVAQRVAETASIEHRGDGLVVRLRAPDTRVLGERTLPLEDDCSALARATAVVLATWLSDAHPEFVPKTPLAPDALTPPPLSVESVAAGSATSAAPPPTSMVRSSGSVTPKSTWRMRAAAALGIGALPSPAAVSGSVAASYVPDGGGVGATLWAGAVSSRSIDVTGGQARYFRWPLGLGAVVRLVDAPVAIELEAGGTLGWLHVEGRSFSPDRTANDVTFGPFAAVRLAAAKGKIRPFLQATSIFWARSARVYADTAEPSQALPSFDLTLSLGAALVP